jgi:hypothetical protein
MLNQENFVMAIFFVLVAAFVVFWLSHRCHSDVKILPILSDKGDSDPTVRNL